MTFSYDDKQQRTMAALQISVEHVIKIHRVVTEEQEINQSLSDCTLPADETSETHSLFTVTLYNTKCKVPIQGPFRDQWIVREFPQLQEMVSVLEQGLSISEAYNQCTGGTKKLNITSADDLNISDVDEDDGVDVDEPGKATDVQDSILKLVGDGKTGEEHSGCTFDNPPRGSKSKLPSAKLNSINTGQTQFRKREFEKVKGRKHCFQRGAT